MPFHFYLFLGPGIKNSSIWASLLDPFRTPFWTPFGPWFSEFQWFPNSSGFQIPVVSKSQWLPGNHWNFENTGIWKPLDPWSRAKIQRGAAVGPRRGIQ